MSPTGTVALVVLQSAAVLYLYKDVPPGASQELFAGGGASMVALALLSLAATAVVLVAGFAQRRQPALRSHTLGGGDVPASRA